MWQLIEGQNYVSLNQGTVNLVVGYRHVTEDPNICCRQRLPEGELVQTGSVTCQGEEIEKSLLQCEGVTKAVIYQGTEEVAVEDLRFLFYLEDFNADYGAAGIPEDVQGEVDRVVSSLETFEPISEFATATPRPTRLPPTPEPTLKPTATPRPALAEAQPDGANVRSGPGTDYALQGTLEGGERIEIVGRYGDWWQIVYRGRAAWVYDGVVATSNVARVPRVEALPTQVPSSPTQIPTPALPSSIREARWIDVDLSEQRLTAYENGQAVHTTLVSTGLPRTPTVQGQFRIWIKLRADDMEGPDYYLEDVPYVMYFYQGYGLHGAPWHNNFGHRMSHGCVNLPVPEAEWLFNFADVGTLVNVRP
jgi:lipoprotein-anchoring transpeptidase ErfK/SrfK